MIREETGASVFETTIVNGPASYSKRENMEMNNREMRTIIGMNKRRNQQTKRVPSGMIRPDDGGGGERKTKDGHRQQQFPIVFLLWPSPSSDNIRIGSVRHERRHKIFISASG